MSSDGVTSVGLDDQVRGQGNLDRQNVVTKNLWITSLFYRVLARLVQFLCWVFPSLYDTPFWNNRVDQFKAAEKGDHKLDFDWLYSKKPVEATPVDITTLTLKEGDCFFPVAGNSGQGTGPSLIKKGASNDDLKKQIQNEVKVACKVKNIDQLRALIKEYKDKEDFYRAALFCEFAAKSEDSLQQKRNLYNDAAEYYKNYAEQIGLQDQEEAIQALVEAEKLWAKAKNTEGSSNVLVSFLKIRAFEKAWEYGQKEFEQKEFKQNFPFQKCIDMMNSFFLEDFTQDQEKAYLEFLAKCYKGIGNNDLAADAWFCVGNMELASACFNKAFGNKNSENYWVEIAKKQTKVSLAFLALKKAFFIPIKDYNTPDEWEPIIAVLEYAIKNNNQNIIFCKAVKMWQEEAAKFTNYNTAQKYKDARHPIEQPLK